MVSPADRDLGPLQLKPVSDQVGEGGPSLRLRTSDAVSRRLRRRRRRPREFASLRALRGEEEETDGGRRERRRRRITKTRYFFAH